jgi:hypothetical protein
MLTEGVSVILVEGINTTPTVGMDATLTEGKV